MLAEAVVLHGRLLGRGQDGVDAVRLAADVEDDGARLDAADGAGDDLALEVGELAEDLLALRLAQALQDDLLGGLSMDAAERRRVELLELDPLTELRVGLHGARFLERELEHRVLDLLDRGHGPEDADLAGLAVDLDADVLVARGDAAVGRLDGLFDGPDERLARDVLLCVQLQKGADEIAAHVAPPLALV